MRRTIAACVLAGFLPLTTTGCFGGFELTKKVYRFNKGVSPDKWIREIVFLVLVIVPIYEIASLVDAVVLNSLEFWTGKNPVLAHDGDSQTIQTAQGTATLTRLSASSLDVSLRSTTGEEQHFVMTREGDGFAARAPDGSLLGRVAEVDGRPALVEHGG
jgi:hypothetical protein